MDIKINKTRIEKRMTLREVVDCRLQVAGDLAKFAILGGYA